MLTHGILAALAAVLLAATTNGQGMYSKNSAVLQVDGKSYKKLITKSNQVSVSPIQEFSAARLLMFK